MKKSIFVVLVVSAVSLLGISCTTTNSTTNTVGWSAYSDITYKDYDAVKIVKVESTETLESRFFGLFKKLEGSSVTYSQLMDEAAKAGADDIINVRIDRKFDTSQGNFLAKKTVYTYYATAVAIKYKDTKSGSIAGSGKTNTPNSSGASSGESFLRKIPIVRNIVK